MSNYWGSMILKKHGHSINDKRRPEMSMKVWQYERLKSSKTKLKSLKAHLHAENESWRKITYQIIKKNLLKKECGQHHYSGQEWEAACKILWKLKKCIDKSNFQVTSKTEPFQKFVRIWMTSFFLSEGFFARLAKEMAKKKLSTYIKIKYTGKIRTSKIS